MEPKVLAELVEQHEPEVLVTSGLDLPAAAVEAGTAENKMPVICPNLSRYKRIRK